MAWIMKASLRWMTLDRVKTKSYKSWDRAWFRRSGRYKYDVVGLLILTCIVRSIRSTVIRVSHPNHNLYDNQETDAVGWVPRGTMFPWLRPRAQCILHFIVFRLLDYYWIPNFNSDRWAFAYITLSLSYALANKADATEKSRFVERFAGRKREERGRMHWRRRTMHDCMRLTRLLTLFNRQRSEAADPVPPTYTFASVVSSESVAPFQVRLPLSTPILTDRPTAFRNSSHFHLYLHYHYLHLSLAICSLLNPSSMCTRRAPRYRVPVWMPICDYDDFMWL